MVMRWSFGGSHKQNYDLHVLPVISQVTDDTFNNGLIAIYYGERVFEGSGDYLQEITLVFKDEHLRKHKYLDVFYRLVRRLLYGRIVDIETFYVHITGGKADYCLFPKIYSGNNDIHADRAHLDNKPPYPKRPIIKWATNTANATNGNDDDLVGEDTFCYLFPYIYVNTSNHAMATHDTNLGLPKTLYQPNPKKSRWQRNNSGLKINFLTRSQVDKKYKKHR
jgi:hypothetical protein